jgi:3-hydroxybutyryl-CoA dehydrogenase
MNNKKIVVIGLGLLGKGIVTCFLGHGFEVIAIDKATEHHARIRDEIGRLVREMVELGGFDAALLESWSRRLTITADFSLARDCTFAVETVTEDVATKEAVLDALEAIISPSVIIATNTSAIPISQLQRKRKTPERFVGMHWAEPAHATRFMELIRGEKTSDHTLQIASAMARLLGKEPCICQKDIPGFIVNRIGYAMYREAMNLVASGVADPATIDTAMRNALGLWASVCGPFRWIDITGGPELYAKAMSHVVPTLNNSSTVPAPIQKLAGEGARGITNGTGFYQYTPEEARHWEELYRKHAWHVCQLQNEYFPIKKES